MGRKGVALLMLLLLLLAGCASRQAPDPTPDPPPPAAEGPPPALKAEPAPPVVKEGPAWVDLAVRVDDGPWEPVRYGATYPKGRLALRFDLHGPVDERPLLHRLPPGAKVERPGPDRVVASWDEPPPAIDLFEIGEPPGEAVRIYIGEPPRLVALDPASGQERALGEVPVDIEQAHLSPDRRWTLLIWRRIDSGEQAFLLDLKSGQRWERQVRYDPFRANVAWWGDAVVLANPRSLEYWEPGDDRRTTVESQGEFWEALSPDGRYLAGYTYDQKVLGKDWVPPATVVIFDLQERTERLYQGPARPKVFNHGVDFYLAWTPDGQGLLLEDHPTRESVRGVRLDLAGGQTEEIAPGRIAPPADQPVAGSSGYAYRLSRWGEVRVVDATGNEQEFGTGYVIGWLPDGELLVIRWPNAANRIIYGM